MGIFYSGPDFDCLLASAYGSSLTAGPHPSAVRTNCLREMLLGVSRHANLEMHREKFYS